MSKEGANASTDPSFRFPSTIILLPPHFSAISSSGFPLEKAQLEMLEYSILGFTADSAVERTDLSHHSNIPSLPHFTIPLKDVTVWFCYHLQKLFPSVSDVAIIERFGALR